MEPIVVTKTVRGLIDGVPAMAESVSTPVRNLETRRAPIILDSSQVAVVEARLERTSKAISTLKQGEGAARYDSECTPPRQLSHVLFIVSARCIELLRCVVAVAPR